MYVLGKLSDVLGAVLSGLRVLVMVRYLPFLHVLHPSVLV
jgi:hypothetical protein